MKNKPLVSIIVPVYKAEKYIDRCIKSLLEQTYGNLEIILVDDGSPDQSGDICDEYASRDSRIKVIHQQNGGASAARNTALDVFQGDYVTFVDSDDWIERDLVELCLQLCSKEDYDVVIYRLENVFADHTELQKIEEKYYVSTEKIIEGVLWDTVPSYPVRFFKGSLWKKVRFPLQTNWEDLAVMPDIFQQVRKAVYIDKALYHYECTNNNSTSSNLKSKNKFGMYLGWRKRMELAQERGIEDLRKHGLKRSLRSAITALGINTQDKLLLPQQIIELKEYISREQKNCNNVGFKYKLLIWGLFHCPSILNIYGKIMFSLQGLKK